jgi:sec-independent protein translocase protein TatB
MFDFGWSELLLVAAVALLVIGPKDLPVAMRAIGKWVGKARAMTRHVRAGFDEMVRQAELEEMEKEWKRHNEAIMASTGPLPDLGAPFADDGHDRRDREISAGGVQPAGAGPASSSPPGQPEPDHAGEPPQVDFGQPDAGTPASPRPGPESAR